VLHNDLEFKVILQVEFWISTEFSTSLDSFHLSKRCFQEQKVDSKR